MKKKLLAGLAVGLMVCGVAGLANATITQYGNRASFDAQGSIAYNSNFQDFGTGFGFPGNPFTRGDVTYHSAQNLTWGAGTWYTTTETLIGNNYWTPVLGDIATGPQYDMFGFDIGTWGANSISITLFTNTGSYTYPGVTIANSLAGQLDFKGYTTSVGEYFTGFNITADAGPGASLPGITNVALGNTGGNGAPVPEPATMLLLGTGLTGMVAARRKKKA